MAKTYRDVESKRGNKSFDSVRTEIYRGKPCNLQRHFRKDTLLRAMVSRADMMAENDKTGRRFIFETKWKTLLARGYSQSAIDRAERICEGSGIFTPARGKVNGRELNGWIVLDHAKHRTLIENGEMCQLDITLNSTPPHRKRGERRWKTPDVNQSPFRDSKQESVPDNPGDGQSPFTSPFPQSESPFVSPLLSPFTSPFPEESESISATPTLLQDNDLSEADERNGPSKAVKAVKSMKAERTKAMKLEQESTPEHSPLPSLLEANSKPDGQVRALVNELACISDGTVFNLRCQEKIARALPVYGPEKITNLWREFWKDASTGSQSWKNGAPVRFCKKLLENDPSLETNPCGTQHEEFSDQADAPIPEMSLGD